MAPAGLAIEPTGRAAATPPGPAVDPTPSYAGGPIHAEGVIWQNGRTTEDMRATWAAGARGAMVTRCGLCTAPLYLSRGELICFGCRSHLPIRWRRRVTELWLTGMQAAEIAKVVGGTKSAVLSYRRRAMLPGRGSPLRGVPDSVSARRRQRTIELQQQGKLIKPKRASPRPAPARVAKVHGSPTCKPAAPGGVVAAENVDHPKGAPRHAPRRGFPTCQYVIGRRTFCDEVTAALSPYCEAHTRLCYVGKAA